jgi:hypothetical protein
MQIATTLAKQPSWKDWTGRIASALVVLFLTLDGVGKLLQIAPVVEASAQLGYPNSLTRGIGIVVLTCAVLYAIPRTAVLGAILLTGLLGGAIASHLRIGSPLFTHVLFGAYVGVLAWGGLWLRDERLRTLVPNRRRTQ